MAETVFTKEMALEGLKNLLWEEGKAYRFIEGPYRHAIEIVCSALGHQKAIFADGQEHKYFAHFRISSGAIGANIVPILPDGRLLMVLQQRPAQQLLDPASSQNRFWADDELFKLSEWGPWTSLEFPGGGIEAGETITMGLLREVFEETGTTGQKVLLYRTKYPHSIFGSDATSKNYYGVVFLPEGNFSRWSESDDGLRVMSFTPEEVLQNIQGGAIMGSPTGLMPWFFYEKVMEIRAGRPNGWENLIIPETVQIK